MSDTGAVVHDAQGSWSIDGTQYPAVGFGTYPLTGDKCATAVAKAAEIGYRIIDTATFYGNYDASIAIAFVLGRQIWSTHNSASESLDLG